MLVTETALGRLVDVNDWLKYHTDTILKILWDVRQLDPAAEAGIATFANATGLDFDRLISLVRALEIRDLLTSGRRSQSFRLSAKGARHVARLLSRAR
jgi:hypothetical protein